MQVATPRRQAVRWTAPVRRSSLSRKPGAIDTEGTCHYSHLGLTTSAATQIIILQTDNTLLITNRNGDKLFSTFVGTGVFTATGVSFSGTETYNGGTGRFADAAGSATLVGSAEFTSPSAGVGQFSVEGTRSY
jgi:hypothetical protein